MSILSDATLRARIAGQELVIDAESDHVEFCSYQFTAEKIMEPGPDGMVFDWGSASLDETYVVRPGQMLWVRTRGTVRIPSDLCAFYWQTNTLARKGLMLVNSSMVEPGYEGPLACLFANFGKDDIAITPRTKVAKLIFFSLDRAAQKPSTLHKLPRDYDDELREVALHAPRSFLQVGEMSTNLSKHKEDAIAEIRREADAARKKEMDKLRTDYMQVLRQALGVAFIGLTILVLAINIAEVIKTRIRPNVSAEVQDDVEVQVKRALAVQRAVALPTRDSIDASTAARIGAMQQELDRLDAEVKRSLSTRRRQ